MRNPRPVRNRWQDDEEQNAEGWWAAVLLAAMVTLALFMLALWGNG